MRLGRRGVVENRLPRRPRARPPADASRRRETPRRRMTARERRTRELDLGYGRLKQLYELSKLLGTSSPAHSGTAALHCLARTVPLRIAVIVEAAGGMARATAATAPGVPEGELHDAVEHARGCAARLCAAELQAGPLALDAEPLPAPVKPGARGRSDFAALPLVLDRSAVRGALYVRGARPLGEADLAFLSAAADQL